jgi:hypothetical protein
MSLALPAGVLLAGGCQLILGIGGELPLEQEGTAGEAPATGGSGGGPAAGGSGGVAGGNEGQGLTGPCLPGEVAACYTGRSGTADVGICKSGTAVCPEEGVWGECGHQVFPEPESCATAADEDCNGHDCSLWVHAFKGALTVTGLALDGTDGVIASMTIKGEYDLGEGPLTPEGSSDALLLKLDKAGHILWKRVLSGPDDQIITAVAADPAGNIILSGLTRTNLDLGGTSKLLGGGGFVAKLTPDGEAIWAETALSDVGPPGMEYLAVDSKGDIVVASNSPDVTLGAQHYTGPDQIGFFVAKLSGATGAPAWVTVSQAVEIETLSALRISPSDDIVLAGELDGPTLGLAPGDCSSEGLTPAPFVARLAANGAFLDAAVLATPGALPPQKIQPFSLAVDSQGTPMLVGDFHGDLTFASGAYTTTHQHAAFIVRSMPGDGQWSRVFLGDPDDKLATSSAQLVAVDGHDNIVMTGLYGGKVHIVDGVPPETQNVYVLKLDPGGGLVFRRTYYFGDGVIQGLALSRIDDHAVLAGTFFGRADFELMSVVSPQGVFLMKIGK